MIKNPTEKAKKNLDFSDYGHENMILKYNSSNSDPQLCVIINRTSDLIQITNQTCGELEANRTYCSHSMDPMHEKKACVHFMCSSTQHNTTQKFSQN